MHLSAQHACSAICQSEVILSPCDSHIGKAPLLFLGFIIDTVECHGAGEYAVLHAGEVDMGKLKSLGAVQGHQKDSVLIVPRLIDG